MVTFQICKFQFEQRFELSTDGKLDGPSPLSKNSFKFQFVWPQSRFPFHLSPFSISIWPEKTALLDPVHTWLVLFHDRALTCICGWHRKLGSQKMISGSVPEPVQWFPWQNHVKVIMQSSVRAQRLQETNASIVRSDACRSDKFR